MSAMFNPELALHCVRLSAEIYRDFADIRFPSTPNAKVTLLPSETKGIDTQAAVLYQEEHSRIFLAFRGSDSKDDWRSNIQFRQQIYPYGDESKTDVRLHRGFMAAYFAVRDRVLDVMKQHPSATVIVTGHSLGGALATVAALDVQYNITQHTQQPLAVYSFGAPRVGNAALVESFEQRVPHSYRYVYGHDLVTHIPRVWQGYRHVPTAINYGPSFSWNVFSRKFKDHEIQNYITALEVALHQGS